MKPFKSSWALLFLAMPIFAFADSKPLHTCVSGRAGEFPCMSADLLSKIDLSKSGIPDAVMGNGVWGWTDPVSKREYAIMGLSNKASFVDITDPYVPRHVGDLLTQTTAIVWRDIKVYKDHAFIVSEAMHHGMQIFDLTQLRKYETATKPVVFQTTAHYNKFGNAHTLAVNEESGFAYAVGTDTCDAGLHVVDIRNPRQPKFSTCIDRSVFEPGEKNPLLHKVNMKASLDEAYTHETQCVTYHGPDADYQGHELCIASNDDTINLVDVTNKAAPRQIYSVKYAGSGFVHQGWLTEDHRYYLQGDELDEIEHRTNTRTYIFDFTDLDNPKQLGFYDYGMKAVDHNLYIKGNYAYCANYAAGLRILDLTNIAKGQLFEVAYFDIVPKDDRTEMFGAWSVYPYFASGTIAISGMDNVLYLVRANLK